MACGTNITPQTMQVRLTAEYIMIQNFKICLMYNRLLCKEVSAVKVSL